MEPRSEHARDAAPAFLLVGPYDPTCGEYTFLSPPLGVWRLQGVLAAHGFQAHVFDPNCQEGPPEQALEAELARRPWDVVGFSTTGMTLRHDLALAHLARRTRPGSVLVAGGMEATFNPGPVLAAGGFDLAVLGEGERPLLEMGARLRRGQELRGVAGTAFRREGGGVERLLQPALDRAGLRDAILATPYERMPYRAYWRRLEERYRVGALPVKADREARLAEIRSVRLITLNYCPMACTFCSATNFLAAAQGGTARIARLDAAECLHMLERIVAAYPEVRTVIFQDDIFVFTSDARVLPLCEGIVAAKERGDLPRDLQFISTNRIDAMTRERLGAMRRAGFRVLGFGVESFSPSMLREFNKAQIHPHIAPVLAAALELGMTPFLDMILTSPRATLSDVATSVVEAYRWVLAGCEVGMYPYVIPFSGAAMASDPALAPHTVHAAHAVAGTGLVIEQAAKILPADPATRAAVLAIESEFQERLAWLERRVPHLPSRVRSLLWIACAAPVLAAAGEEAPDVAGVVEELLRRLPLAPGGARREARERLAARAALEEAALEEVAV